MARQDRFPVTPDGRYFVVRGRLWRTTNPNLSEETRRHWVSQLMTARREIAAARREGRDPAALRRQVDEAKRALGERGPVWWTDGSADYNRHMAKNTPYASWFEAVTDG